MWNWDLSQKYTFEHAASVQALAFNPITPNLLATASAVDFAIWTMPSNSLKKIKVPARVCCAAWTSDGQFLTLGLHNGTISMRDQGGVEKLTIKRSAPVWDLSWAPAKSGDGGGAGGGGAWVDTLSVACWDGTLSFYGVDGKAIGKERVAPGGQGSDPTSIRPFFNQDYLLVAGSDGKTSLATRDGIKLNTLVEGKAWTWRALPKPRSTSFVTVSNDGVVAMHNLVFSTVHGLYGDRYASRESCTDVLVRHLVSDARVRIKCRCVFMGGGVLSCVCVFTPWHLRPHTRRSFFFSHTHPTFFLPTSPTLFLQGLCEEGGRVPRPSCGAAV